MSFPKDHLHPAGARDGEEMQVGAPRPLQGGLGMSPGGRVRGLQILVRYLQGHRSPCPLCSRWARAGGGSHRLCRGAI